LKGTAYLLQATLVALWWIGIKTNQIIYDAFQFPQLNKVAFGSFLLPDVIVIIALSLARSYKEIKELDYIILGGFTFATLYCINISFLTRGGYLSTALMTLGLFYNLFLVFQNHTFRISKTKNLRLNILKTIIQIIGIWSISLIFLPYLILKSFSEFNYFLIENKIIGILCFLAFSIIGLLSAYYLVLNGEGTPLPLDQTKNLVITGPYKIIRNPMAVAGIGQGISISIYFGSIPILVYSLLGALIWHLVVKPTEEKDMELRFGKEYIKYKRNVSCWIPSFKKKSFI
jgi:protein-S-isoprenylcysteine O-methyltransferase Ste14